MALGTITKSAGLDSPGGPTPVFADLVSFLGDSTYPAGGTPGFQAAFRAAVGKGAREILAVIPGNAGDLLVTYDKANDKLFCRLISTGAEASGDLSGTTINLVVLSK